jgi:hypothetical protein
MIKKAKSQKKKTNQIKKGKENIQEACSNNQEKDE